MLKHSFDFKSPIAIFVLVTTSLSQYLIKDKFLLLRQREISFLRPLPISLMDMSSQILQQEAVSYPPSRKTKFHDPVFGP